MNEEAFETTLKTGKMTYWSRSRQELWTKGMTSGHLQYVKPCPLTATMIRFWQKSARLALPAIPVIILASTGKW